MANIYFLSYN
jgi:uridine phosphorylase